MRVVLLGHRKNVGKDTIADILCDHADKILGPGRGMKLGFADAIKEEAYRLFSSYGLKRGPFYDEPSNYHLRNITIPKLHKSPRDIWISLGTWGRTIDQLLWANLIANVAQQAQRVPKLVVVKDFRYTDSESIPFDRLGISTLKVNVKSERAGELDGPDRAGLDYQGWHYTFFNDCSRDQLPGKVTKEIWPRILEATDE